jgi:RNA polymerase sigma-70 factor (ECF subfamily)
MTMLPWKHTDSLCETQTLTFEELAFPLLPSLHNMALWLTRGATFDAEDLVRETILKAFRGFATLEPGTNFKTWIFKILRNTYLTSRSGLAANRTVSIEGDWGESGESGPGPCPKSAIDRKIPDMNLIQMGDCAAIQAAMEKLPSPLLEVILLSDVEEMKYKEIAVILEIPIGTVMSHISRARAGVLRALSQYKLSTECNV